MFHSSQTGVMKKFTVFLVCCLVCYFSKSQIKYKSPKDLFLVKNFTIPGNTNKAIDVNIQLEENDYVYIEAIGQIKVGNYMGYADPTGLISSSIFSSSYEKYKGIELGSLVILTNFETTGCKRIFRNFGQTYNVPGITEYDPDKITKSPFRDYIPGYYFISKGNTPLYFAINDKIIDDNSDSFKVSVFVIKFRDHLNRNYFNICPEKEPENGDPIKHYIWNKESLMSFYYHGTLNSSYRGGSYDNAGCQCVYGDFSKTLVQNEKNQGSFDIGYWLLRSGTDPQPVRNYYHLVLDVIPHDLFEEKFGKEKTIYKIFKNSGY
jgi:hypothetical protein